MQRRHFTAALAATVAAPFAGAQSWPSRPIKVLVGYPPGGFTDVTARLIADKLSARLGQSVIVDNKPGANGIVAVDTLAKSAPDGNTFAVVIAAHAANTSLYKKLPYDPKQVTGVSLIGISPLVYAAPSDSPFKNAKELVAYAKANPGKISYGSSGNGSAVHLSTELLKSVTGTRMVHIPYRGSAAAFTDLLGGQIHLLGDAAQGMIGKGDKVRLLGVASEKRLPALPDVPTFIEQGVQGYVASTWAGLLAPAGTPAPILKRVADEIAAIVKMDDVKARLDAMGTIPVGSSPAEFDRFIAAESAKWGKVIREAKVSLD
jgi:tripartite-type tricarboxylate transporter receptor subunit TctC